MDRRTLAFETIRAIEAMLRAWSVDNPVLTARQIFDIEEKVELVFAEGLKFPDKNVGRIEVAGNAALSFIEGFNKNLEDESKHIKPFNFYYMVKCCLRQVLIPEDITGPAKRLPLPTDAEMLEPREFVPDDSIRIGTKQSASGKVAQAAKSVPRSKAKGKRKAAASAAEDEDTHMATIVVAGEKEEEEEEEEDEDEDNGADGEDHDQPLPSAKRKRKPAVLGRKRWTPLEDRQVIYLRTYERIMRPEIAERLGRTLYSINDRCKVLDQRKLQADYRAECLDKSQKKEHLAFPEAI